jgi:hypothetical protein
MPARTGYVEGPDPAQVTDGPHDEADDVSEVARGGRLRRLDRRWIFPAVVMVLWALLTASGLNGSSVGALSDLPGGDSSVLAGNPREIRSDEFYVRTPIVAGQAERGFPARAELGVGEHDLTVLVDLPTSDWSMAFRPHLWGYWILPLDQAFAFDWWGLSAVLLLGGYAFLLVLTRRPAIAALGAIALWASPFFHWWYLALSLAVAGYGLGATALLLASMRDRLRPRTRWLLVAASAYAFGCFALTFYPPFQVPLALVVGAAALGYVVQRVRRGAVGWRPAIVNTAVAGGAAGVVAVMFALTRTDTLSAIMNTTYPGTRRSTGGGAPTGFLASSWFGLKYVQEPEELRGRVLPNESEASSFLLLGCFLLPALPLLWSRIVGVDRRLKGALVGALAAMALVGAHMYLSLPGPLARATLLDRVPPQRAIIGLGMASLLVAVCVGSLLQRAGAAVGWRRRLASGGITAAVAVGYVVALSDLYQQSGAPVGRNSTLVAVVSATVVAATFFWRPVVGLGALAVVGLAVSLSVNPLTRGLDSVTDAPLTLAVERIDAASGDQAGAWLNTIDMSVPALAAAGVQDVSAVNLYPDHDAWQLLDVDSSDEDLWNRYAHTRWTLDPSAPQPTVGLLSNDTVAITIDPCGPELDQLEVRHVVTPKPVDASCLVLVERTRALDGGPALIYERTSSAG